MERVISKNRKREFAYKKLSLAIVLSASMSFGQAADLNADSDKDSIVDVIDNCVKVFNPLQRDTDGDGFGNRCDADFDNNNIVDDRDIKSLLTRFKTDDPDGDLDGNGTVDGADLEIAEALFKQPPGPSGFGFEPSFVKAPPPALNNQLFELNKERENGDNAAILVSFKGVEGLKSVIPFNFSGRTIALNDLGILPDQERGDGLYSSFFNFDFKSQLRNEKKFISRVEKFEGSTVELFSGRSVVGAAKFEPKNPPTGQKPIELEDGTVLTPFFPAIDFTPLLPMAHNEAKSLMVTHPSVTADFSRTFDPCDVDGDGNLGNVNGAWSFKTLMTNMANTSVTGISAQEFTHNWLLNWMSPQTVNGFTVFQRTNMQNFFGGWDGVNASTLDMNNLPFRLLAIVNRIDLASTSSYGQTGQPGEIRFVFGLVDPASPSCTSGNLGSTQAMTVIFEYGDTSSFCTSVKARANEWIDLSSMAFGTAAFNAALQAITDDVTTANAMPNKPNGSALNQLRTNEIALSFPWQLREFVIDSGSASLVSATIKQTPDPALFRNSSLVTKQFMETNADAISCESHVVPDTFAGNPFLGSHADYGFGTVWTAHPTTTIVPGAGFCTETTASGTPTLEGTVRHKLSLNTCDDCHSGETQTAFTHVKPQSFPTTLSGFLTGITVPDPLGAPVTREFDDLARRGQIMEDLAVKSCKSGVFVPVLMDPVVHFPPIDPVFKVDLPRFNPEVVDFSRVQQRSTFVH